MHISVAQGPNQQSRMTNDEVADFIEKHPNELDELVVTFNQGTATLVSTPHLASNGFIAKLGKYFLYSKREHTFALMHIDGKAAFRPVFNGMGPIDKTSAISILETFIAEQKAAFTQVPPLAPTLTADMIARIVAEQLLARDAAAAVEKDRKAEADRKAEVIRKAEEDLKSKLKEIEERAAKLAELEGAFKKKVQDEIKRLLPAAEEPELAVIAAPRRPRNEELAVYAPPRPTPTLDLNIVVMSVAAVVIALLFVLVTRAPTVPPTVQPQDNSLVMYMMTQAEERRATRQQEAKEMEVQRIQWNMEEAEKIRNAESGKIRMLESSKNEIVPASSVSDFVWTVVYFMVIMCILIQAVRFCMFCRKELRAEKRRLRNA
jgi:hypothetical protein